ncbi:MAG TPA: electron transport complex subunit RsxC [Bacillota bacterium]|nr:electron transport complex subunit RsxC [Bacillota bacterium]
MGGATFKGGVHPDYRKELTASLAITAMPAPAKVVIPLQQHIGAPCEALVQVGDTVKLGQKIGESKGFVSAPVHASVSGTVVAIGPYNHPLGRKVEAITIESDGQDTWHEDIKPHGSLESLSPEEIKAIIREAGLVGMGGATFPAHVKLAPPPEKPIDTVIINGAECEPYLTADHRLMLEKPNELVFGLKIMLKALGASVGIIGIENNKPDALRVMRQAVEGEANISVVALPTKYPQGAEKMLIYATTRRKVPSGGLPMDVGVVNHNVGTAVAMCEALHKGKPLVERVVTVTGEGVARPANLMVRIGTLVSEVLKACGGLKETTRKLIIGGPMMGLAQTSADIPVIKGTSGILALTEENVDLSEPSTCIKCAKCVGACPVNLVPTFIAQAAEHELIQRAEKLHAADCIECGCCSFICPSRIPLTQWIRLAKADILERRRQQQK